MINSGAHLGWDLIQLCVCMCALSCVQLFVTPWTIACQLLCPWNFQARILEWVAISSSKGSPWSRHWTHISFISRQILYHCPTWEARPFVCLFQKNTYSKPLSVLIGLFAFLLLSCMNFLWFFTGIQFISIYLSVCLSINAVLFSYEKEGNHVICNDMNGPWWNYAKWNKLDRERQGLPWWLRW